MVIQAYVHRKVLIDDMEQNKSRICIGVKILPLIKI